MDEIINFNQEKTDTPLVDISSEKSGLGLGFYSNRMSPICVCVRTDIKDLICVVQNLDVNFMLDSLFRTKARERRSTEAMVSSIRETATYPEVSLES